MSDHSGIEWTDATWNPVVGCSVVSPGCHNCYAATMAKRLRAMGRPEYRDVVDDKGNWTGTLNTIEERLTEPLRWRRPRMVFVNSMSDLFHRDVPCDFIDRVFAVMALSSQHTFQVLTKRAAGMEGYLRCPGRADLIYSAMEVIAAENGIADFLFDAWPLPNVWLGVSCEEQLRADQRIPHLLNSPAEIRFLSVEPLLGWLDFQSIVYRWMDSWPKGTQVATVPRIKDYLQWVIAGGESGPFARPMHPEWLRVVRDQCEYNGIPFFFKQWGEWQNGSALARRGVVHAAVLTNGKIVKPDTRAGRDVLDHELNGRWNDFNPVAMSRVGKHSAGRILDGREWSEFPSACSAPLREKSVSRRGAKLAEESGVTA